MPLPLIPIVVVTAVMTLRSDTKAVTVYVKKPRGTLYWGGAGLNGPYIDDQIQSFVKKGISHVYRGTNTTGFDKVDALWTATTLRYEDSDEWTISKGLENPSGQFNLIGYSYGSMLAAQTAHFYANQGHIVDKLVLIGCPIDANFLAKLKNHKNIKMVIVINLTEHGDPIHAGMTQIELLSSATKLASQDDESGTTKGIGHFYYRPDSIEGKARREALADYLYRQGIR